MRVPETMTEPRPIPDSPDVPAGSDVVLLDVVRWYEARIAAVEKIAELAEADKAAIRKWSEGHATQMNMEKAQ